MSLLLALAMAGSVESETVVQVRQDLFGQPQVPVGQYLRVVEQVGPLAVQGYAGLEWMAGGQADLYTLSLSGSQGPASWSAGRLMAPAVLRPWLLDGARAELRFGAFRLGAWGGLARHLGTTGLPSARAEVGWSGGPVTLRTGGMVQAGSLHGDAELWLVGAGLRSPSLRLLWVGGDEAVDWGRVELEVRPMGRLRTTVHAQHREAVDPQALFGEALTATLAPGGVDELGGSLKLSSSSWASWHGSYALLATGGLLQPLDEVGWGHAVDLRYQPAPSTVWVSPAYRFRSGPGGVFHALYAVSELGNETRRLRLQAGVVPYHKLREPWDTALTASLQVEQTVRSSTLRVGADVAPSYDGDASPRLTVAWVSRR